MIAYRVFNMRATFQNLVDAFTFDIIGCEVALCSAGCNNLETKRGQFLNSGQNACFVIVAHRDKHRST